MKRLLGIVSLLTLALVISLPFSAGAAGKGKSAPAPDPAVQPAPEPAPAVQPAPEPAPAVQPAPTPEPPKGSGVMVGIGDMKISGILQAYFTLAQTQVGNATDGYDTELNNSFTFRRARIFLMGSILPDKVKYVFQGDAANDGSLSGNTTDGYKFTPNPWLLDARLIFVNALPQTEIQVGRFLPNFTYYMPQLVSKLDFAEYPLLTSKYAMWRQVGIQSTTKLGITSLNVGIYNSVSQNCQNTWKDADNWKDFLLRLNIKPNDKIETAVYATFGETGVTGTSDYLMGIRAGAFLRATVSGLTALAEILYAMDESDPDNINGIVVYGQAGYKVVPKVEPMVRVEYYEPNLDADNDQTIRLTGGINYYIIGTNAMLSLNAVEDLKDPENLFTLYTQAQVAF